MSVFVLVFILSVSVLQTLIKCAQAQNRHQNMGLPVCESCSHPEKNAWWQKSENVCLSDSFPAKQGTVLQISASVIHSSLSLGWGTGENIELFVVCWGSWLCCRYRRMCWGTGGVPERPVSECGRVIHLWMSRGLPPVPLWGWVYWWVFYTRCHRNALIIITVHYIWCPIL